MIYLKEDDEKYHNVHPRKIHMSSFYGRHGNKYEGNDGPSYLDTYGEWYNNSDFSKGKRIDIEEFNNAKKENPNLTMVEFATNASKETLYYDVEGKPVTYKDYKSVAIDALDIKK